MSNVINKAIAACILAAALTCSCSDKDREAAQALYTQADRAVGASNYAGALVLLDTLNARYPLQTSIRKEALRVRAKAMEGIAMDSITASSQELAEATLAVDSFDGKFRHIDSSVGLEGYYIPVGAQEKVMSGTCIQPRVSDQGFFYIVANVQGQSIGLRALEFVDGAETVSSEPVSASRIVKVEGSETVSFSPEELEAVGPWLASHHGTSKVILKGSKRNVTVKLDDKLRSQLIACYSYAAALQARHRAAVHREKFERMLATARDQLANMPVQSTEN